jgi:hypothetical protein
MPIMASVGTSFILRKKRSLRRLRSAAEETLASLLQPGYERPKEELKGQTPHLLIVARPDSRSVELEFISTVDEENLGDRLAYLDEQERTVDDREISFRLLRHYAASVSHQKYHGMDIVTVMVKNQGG